MSQNIFQRFVKYEPIIKGFSADKKYCVTDASGKKYYLRIAPLSEYEALKLLFAMLKKLAALGVPMCTPVEFGTCDAGVYYLQSWIDGADLASVLPGLSEGEQYVLGVKAGEILRKIHTIPAPEIQEDWLEQFNRETETKIKKYHEYGLQFEGDEEALAYIEQNRHLLKNRPQCFQHGDFHVHNMMIEKGEIKIIDFSYGFGDPWEEMESIRWCVDVSVYFANGMINGYFVDRPPESFWQTLLLYFCKGMFHNLLWGKEHSDEQVESAFQHIRKIREWTDGLKNVIPTWYRESLIF